MPRKTIISCAFLFFALSLGSYARIGSMPPLEDSDTSIKAFERRAFELLESTIAILVSVPHTIVLTAHVGHRLRQGTNPLSKHRGCGPCVWAVGIGFLVVLVGIAAPAPCRFPLMRGGLWLSGIGHIM